MNLETKGLHHHHRKIRKTLSHRYRSLADDIIYSAGVLGPVLTIPQVLKIYVEQNAAGLSLISWISYLFTAAFWIFYGIIHKEKPIIFTYVVWFILQLIIVIGIFIYG